MGYTNYWTPAKGLTTEQKLKMVAFADAVIKETPVLIKGWEGTGKAERTVDVISLNGDKKTGDNHESFTLLNDDNWQFCKTARKPYDEVVKALLIYAKEIGVVSEWSFDGDETEEEYATGMELYKRALKKIK